VGLGAAALGIGLTATQAQGMGMAAPLALVEDQGLTCGSQAQGQVAVGGTKAVMAVAEVPLCCHCKPTQKNRLPTDPPAVAVAVVAGSGAHSLAHHHPQLGHHCYSQPCHCCHPCPVLLGLLLAFCLHCLQPVDREHEQDHEEALHCGGVAGYDQHHLRWMVVDLASAQTFECTSPPQTHSKRHILHRQAPQQASCKKG
jgi:hypothetical protein